MKTRLGFVSNSSSSSFILLVKSSKKCKHCGRSDMNFIKEIEELELHDANGDVNIRANGKKDIIHEIRDNWFTCPETTEMIEKLEQLKLKPSEDLIYLDLSYHSGMHEKITNDEIKNVEIIYKSND